MNPLAKILVFLVAVVVLAALLSPPIYWAAQGIPALAGFPFSRFFSRTTQVIALLLIWPCVRWLRIRSLRELGIERNPAARRDAVCGFLAAILPLVLLAVVYFQTGVYKARDEVAWMGLARIAGTAAAVSILEEFLFRAVLLGLAVRHLGRWPGLLLISAVFSVVHFLKPRAEIVDVRWTSGFTLLGHALPAEPGAGILAFGALALFVIGLVLGWATRSTRSLWLAIGLHAGWVFGQQTINLLGKFRVKPPDAWLPWVGPNVVSGMVPTGVVPLLALLVSGLLVWWYLARAPRETARTTAGGTC